MRHTESSSAVPTLDAPSTEMKRMSFLISAGAHREMMQLSKSFNETMTSLIRIGLALVRIALEARRQGERIIVVGPDGTPRRELVIPVT